MDKGVFASSPCHLPNKAGFLISYFAPAVKNINPYPDCTNCTASMSKPAQLFVATACELGGHMSYISSGAFCHALGLLRPIIELLFSKFQAEKKGLITHIWP
jgi:hypothetical protein